MNLTSLAFYIAPVIGVTTLCIGITAALWPQPMSKKFGIAASDNALPYVVSTGVRDIFMGLTVLLLYYQQDWKLLGIIQLCLGLVAISDFRVVQLHGDKKVSLVHLAGAIAVIGYGIWLIL